MIGQPTVLTRPARSGWPWWRQIGGFLLAALIALTVPAGSADHADVLFDRHRHDPVTGAPAPLTDDHGHPIAAGAAETAFAAEHSGRLIPAAAPALFSLERIAVAAIAIAPPPIRAAPPPPGAAPPIAPVFPPPAPPPRG